MMVETSVKFSHQSTAGLRDADLCGQVDGEDAVRHRVELAEDALRHRRLPGADRSDKHDGEVVGHEATHQVRVAHCVDGRYHQLVERQATIQHTTTLTVACLYIYVG